MKKTIIYITAAILIISAAFLSFKNTGTPIEIDHTSIHWYTLEEALAANEKEPKKIFIDMYTDWCGWCKVMDQKTFTHQEVITKLNTDYYCVKFNADQTAPVNFNGKSYKFIPSGRKGIHELAYTLLDRKPSYPSFVVLDENLDRLNIIKGYLTPERFLPQI